MVGGEAGERVPVALVGSEGLEAYSRDRHARVQEALLPFRRLAKANVSAPRDCYRVLISPSHLQASDRSGPHAQFRWA